MALVLLSNPQGEIPLFILDKIHIACCVIIIVIRIRLVIWGFKWPPSTVESKVNQTGNFIRPELFLFFLLLVDYSSQWLIVGYGHPPHHFFVGHTHRHTRDRGGTILWRGWRCFNCNSNPFSSNAIEHPSNAHTRSAGCASNQPATLDDGALHTRLDHQHVAPAAVRDAEFITPKSHHPFEEEEEREDSTGPVVAACLAKGVGE